MKQIDQIFQHPIYQEALHKIEIAEKERMFCKHDIEHFLSVARLSYIYDLQEGGGLSKEIIYAAALLHDIGRAVEYETGKEHHEASARIAEKILPDCGFSQDQQLMIRDAVLFHRKKEEVTENRLGRLLYKADKASRNCFACSMRKQCKWPMEKMNLKIYL